MTPTKEQLLALALRVEQATGPDRELDGDIAIAVNAGSLPGAWKEKSDVPEYARLGYVRHHFNGGRSLQESKCYTASLDAAMSLVPEGWKVSGLFQRNCKLPNWIWKAELWSPEADENVRGIARNADVPALAIAAAALRARAHAQEVK